MSTCETCKWWKATNVDEIKSFDPDVNTRIKNVEQTTRTCSNPKLNGQMDCYGKLADPSHATPRAADDHGIGFETGKDFGCIHHEPK